MSDFDLNTVFNTEKGQKRIRWLIGFLAIIITLFVVSISYFTVTVVPKLVVIAQEDSKKSALINSMNNTINAQNTQIQNMKTLINYTNTVLSLTKNITDAITNQNIQLGQSVRDKEAELQNMVERLYSIQRSYNYTLHDPTYVEMISFVQNNTVDQNVYHAPDYVCYNFAIDFVNDAFHAGLRCGYVQIVYTNGSGHAVVAFQTLDRGLTYIEPQNDNVITLNEGGIYWGNPIAKINVVW